MATIERNGSKIFLNVDGTYYYYDERKAPLGSGAMGTVYLGYSYKTGEPVAVKRVNDRYANISSIRERAKQEASLMFRHRNLIEMIGCCEEYPDRGAFYIVSRYVQGENIDTFIKRNYPQNSVDRVSKICTIFNSVLDALSYIHSYGIIHMDIKPSNIMVENGKNVRLMDLGIAHVNHSLSIEGTPGLMGTPRYAAPEQFDACSEAKLDARTDIYEAGVTLYELLTGYNPYNAKSIAESVKAHRTVVLPYTPLVPKALIDVLRVATDAYHDNRYASVKDFQAAISKALTVKTRSANVGLILLLVSVVVLLVTMVLLVLFLQ